MHWRRKWQPTPVFLPGESHGQRWAVIYGVAQSRTRLKQLSSSSNKSETGFPGGSVDKESTCKARDPGVIPGLGRSLGEFHGQRSLASYSPWGLKELDMTEQLTHVSEMEQRVRRLYGP